MTYALTVDFAVPIPVASMPRSGQPLMPSQATKTDVFLQLISKPRSTSEVQLLLSRVFVVLDARPTPRTATTML
jgi:hypothetical protein